MVGGSYRTTEVSAAHVKVQFQLEVQPEAVDDVTNANLISLFALYGGNGEELASVLNILEQIANFDLDEVG